MLKFVSILSLVAMAACTSSEQAESNVVPDTRAADTTFGKDTSRVKGDTVIKM
jgi:hypothetical protein